MKRVSRPIQILIGLAVGIGLGVAFHGSGKAPAAISVAKPIGLIFLNLLFMTVIPVIFCALALGVAGFRDMVKLGRIGLRTLVLTLVISSVAVLIGVALVNTIQPGKGLSVEATNKLKAETGAGKSQVENAKKAKSIGDTLIEIVPKYPLRDAVADPPNFLGWMFFAFLFGLGLASIDPAKAEPVVRLLEAIFDALMKIIGWAMVLAPLGVAALVFQTVAGLGIQTMGLLAKYVVVVVVGLAIHQFVVYSVVLRVFAKISPVAFFRRIQEVMVTAFATSSSNATLPTSLRVTHEKVGVPRDITNFVLTLGSTANQNGTALFEGVTVLFLAQFYGIDLALGDQIKVVALSVLAGVGTAGVPGGSLPVIVMVMQSVGIPGEGIGIILGVDRFLDMCRTTLNVTGDIAVAAVVARGEGHELPK